MGTCETNVANAVSQAQAAQTSADNAQTTANGCYDDVSIADNVLTFTTANGDTKEVTLPSRTGPTLATLYNYRMSGSSYATSTLTEIGNLLVVRYTSAGFTPQYFTTGKLLDSPVTKYSDDGKIKFTCFIEFEKRWAESWTSTIGVPRYNFFDKTNIDGTALYILKQKETNAYVYAMLITGCDTLNADDLYKVYVLDTWGALTLNDEDPYFIMKGDFSYVSSNYCLQYSSGNFNSYIYKIEKIE